MSKKTVEFVLALLCFVISVIPLFFTIILLFLCTIYTKFLSIYLSRKHEMKIELLNGLDGLHAVAEQKVESVNNGTYIFEGETNVDRIKESVRDRWTDVKENGVYKHPKLRCTIAKASGYFYWLPERKFSLDDHVKMYKCAAPQNDEQFYDVLSGICNSPIPDDISPWIIYVFPLAENYGRYAGKPHFVLVGRLHHCLSDGISNITMLGHCLLQEKTVNFKKPKEIPNVSILKTIWIHFSAFFYVPLFVCWLAFHWDSNILHGPKQSGDRLLRYSSTISLDRIKRIGKLTKTTVNDVMTSIVTGVLGRYYEKMNENPLNPVYAILPISLHTSTEKEFCNKASGFVMKLPLDVNYGLLKRLKKIKKTINEQKKSFFYLSVYLIKKWTINRLPSVFSKVIEALTGATLIITNVPAYQDQCFSRFGDKLKFFSGFPAHILKQCLGFSIVSYNGDVVIAMSVDKSVIDDVKSVEWFVETCNEEFESLERNVEFMVKNNYKMK